MKKIITLGVDLNEAIGRVELISNEKGNYVVDYIFNTEQLSDLLAVNVHQCQIVATIINNCVCRFNKQYNTNIVLTSTAVNHSEKLIANRLRFPTAKSEINKFTYYLMQYFDPKEDYVLYWLYNAVLSAKSARYAIMKSAYMEDGILDKGGEKYIDYVKRLLNEAIKALTISDEDFNNLVDDILEKYNTTLDEVTIDNKIIKA